MGWYGAAGILKAVKHCWWLSQAQTQDIRTAIFHPAPQALQAHASSQQWDPAESTVPQIKDYTRTGSMWELTRFIFFTRARCTTAFPNTPCTHQPDWFIRDSQCLAPSSYSQGCRVPHTWKIEVCQDHICQEAMHIKVYSPILHTVCNYRLDWAQGQHTGFMYFPPAK